MANSWLRLYAEFANDPKIQMMGEAEQRRYIMLLCIRCNGDVTLQDEEVAFQLRISNEEWARTKAVFLSKNLIGEDNKPTAWDKRQFASDRPLTHIWRLIRERIFARDDYTCRYCGERGKKLECDHVVPVSKGGGHDDENLVTACFSCNRSKRDKLISEWRAV